MLRDSVCTVLKHNTVFSFGWVMGERELVAAAAIGSWLGARSGQQEPLQVREIVLPCEEAPACPTPAPAPAVHVCPLRAEPPPCPRPQGGLRQYLFDVVLSDGYELEALIAGKTLLTLILGWGVRYLLCPSRRQDGRPARRVGRIRYPSPRHR